MIILSSLSPTNAAVTDVDSPVMKRVGGSAGVVVSVDELRNLSKYASELNFVFCRETNVVEEEADYEPPLPADVLKVTPS